ncbi:MAG TPA: hypothetical protein VFB90_08415 [Dehalococcoidia bacterium]|nr:hypothetical protein [Dehalococcoidia bacterium]
MSFPLRIQSPRLVLLFSILGLALLGFACGGSDNNTNTYGGNAGSSVQQELSKLADSWSKSNARITYTMSGTGSDLSDTGTMVLIWKYPRSRIDITSSDGSKVTIISDSKTTLFCTDQGQAQCISFGNDSGVGLGSADFAGLVNPDTLAGIAQEVPDLKASDRKIIGQDARCFGGTDNQGGNGEICFSKSGLLLLITGGDETGSFRMEATEISKDVQDSAFNPPFPVTDLSDILGGGS